MRSSRDGSNPLVRLFSVYRLLEERVQMKELAQSQALTEQTMKLNRPLHGFLCTLTPLLDRKNHTHIGFRLSHLKLVGQRRTGTPPLDSYYRLQYTVT